MTRALRSVFLSAIAALHLGGMLGCSSDSRSEEREGAFAPAPALDDTTKVTARSAAVIADGCSLDTWQMGALASAPSRRVLREVVLLCLVPRFDGQIGPADPSARASLRAQVASLRQLGYEVKLGLSFTDEAGTQFDGAQASTLLLDDAWVGSVVANLRDLFSGSAPIADGVDVDLEHLPTNVRAAVTSLFARLDGALRPAAAVDAFVPPASSAAPSDIPGFDSFDVAAIAPHVDRLRVMTLDYSADPGPTIDASWAAAAGAFAAGGAGSAAVDVAVPLYGYDFTSAGARPVTYLEARGAADAYRAPIARGSTGAPHVLYTDAEGTRHDCWFDDAASTLGVLHAWTPSVLSPSVGVVFYGLGAEDPALWAELGKVWP